MRLTEFALFLMPLAAWLVWRRVGPQSGPSLLAVGTLAACLLFLAAGLVWFAFSERGGAVYRPAHLDNGVVVPGALVRP